MTQDAGAILGPVLVGVVGDQAGFGLGLSIVRRFANVLGHTVQVKSRVGCGSAFQVTVPMAPAAAVLVEQRKAENLRERLYAAARAAAAPDRSAAPISRSRMFTACATPSAPAIVAA